jgi:hypothetical protein
MKRNVLMALVVVAVLSLSPPALGASASQLARKALHKATRADHRSKRADSRARRALKRARKRDVKGITGAIGPIGPPGTIGQTGSIAPSGPIGPTGLTGPTGSTGPVGNTGIIGPTGSTGDAGPTGSTGPTGTARAYAQVSPSGPSYSSPRTKNFSGSPQRPSTGVYCLTIAPATAIDPEAVAAIASPEAGNTTDHGGSAEVRGLATGSCSAGQFAVHTYDSNGGASSNIGFTIIVP